MPRRFSAQDKIEIMKWRYANGPKPSRLVRQERNRSMAGCLIITLTAVFSIIAIVAVSLLLWRWIT